MRNPVRGLSLKLYRCDGGTPRKTPLRLRVTKLEQGLSRALQRIDSLEEKLLSPDELEDQE